MGLDRISGTEKKGWDEDCNLEEQGLGEETASAEDTAVCDWGSVGSTRKGMLATRMDALAITDLTGRITYVNAAFCQMTGWDEHELVGRLPPFPYWPDEDYDLLMRRLEDELSGLQSPGGFQVRVKRRDGTLFDARMYVSPLVDASGKQTGWMTSMTDITEPNRVREQLTQ